MSEQPTTTEPEQHAREGQVRALPAWHPRAWPWWVRALSVYAAARVLSAVVLVLTAQHQEASYWAEAKPSYLEFTGRFWDADWYRQVAEDGYPAQLPRGDDGQVVQNAWAFYPLFPMVVRALMSLTGAPFHQVAPLLAVVLGGVAMVVIHRLITVGAPRAVAARPGLPLATVALVSAFPTAVVLQIGYTESLALLLVALALLMLVQRRYLETAAVVVALGFTRAVALPMAVVIVVHALVRWRRSRAGSDTLTRRDVGALGGLTVAAAVSGVAWPLICGWVTGEPDAYLQTQATWRGVADVTPFSSWGYVSRFWFGNLAPWVLLASFALVVAVLVVPAAWRLGPELHAWPAAYLLYIAGAVEPSSSLARFLLLAFPLGAVTAGVVTRPARARRLWLALVLLAMLYLQAVWVWDMWRLAGPTGWPP
ncbi:hypothetical protein [Cellulomonas edaphi]|uniref:Integral membrane protein n=1 Tax=Cellulomonas edaphi TaxID=3053468 RepID=A0ABT7S5B1_9CELL|nr:hypothetical protein [Cellulomons edaphi]MDM7830813.1 hypothetical protein [Cellulomons edaphi]